MIWALLLAAAPVEAAYRELVREPAELEVRELPQAFFPGVKFQLVSGWRDGGHRELEKIVFAGRDVVVAEYENVDENGHHRRLKSLRLCPLEHEKAIRGARDDIATLVKRVDERAKVCRALQLKLPEKAQLDAFAELVLSLADASVATLLKSESELKGASRQWVNGAVAFAPWVKTFDGKRFAGLGMVLLGRELALVELRVEGAGLTLVRKSVAFERRFIE